MNIQSLPFDENSNYDEEDQVFEILSHPLRRKMLEYLQKTGGISYSLLLHRWKMSTGSIYHHLKIMESFLYQDENYVYRLNDFGKQSCDKYLQSNNTTTEHSSIRTFSNQVLTFIQAHQLLTIIISIIILNLGYILSRSLDTIIIGPFILSIEQTVFQGKLTSVEPVIFVDMIVVFGLLVFYLVTSYMFYKEKSKFPLKLLVSGYLLSIIPSSLLMVIIYCFTLFESIVISIQLWILICSLTQFLVLLINSAFLIRFCKLKKERSILVVLLNAYLSLSIAYLLI